MNNLTSASLLSFLRDTNCHEMHFTLSDHSGCLIKSHYDAETDFLFLLKNEHVYKQFQEGESRFSKTHVKPTQERRLAILRQLEQTIPEEDLPLADCLRFEAEHIGTPLTVRESERAVYVVLEVDDRYSPKLRLYSVATGNVGVMKVKKL